MRIDNYNQDELNTRNLKFKKRLYDSLLILMGLVPLIFEPYSSFTYFYQNYIVYSFVFILLLLFLCLYWIPQKKFSIKFSNFYDLMIPLIIVTTTLWFIPKLLHYYLIDKKNQCIKTVLTNKSYNPHGKSGFIKFDDINAVPRIEDMIFVNSISGIDEYQYDNLPKKGEKIRICGEVSKIGFSLDYVEAVRDENVSVP